MSTSSSTEAAPSARFSSASWFLQPDFIGDHPDILAVYQVKTTMEILSSLHFPLKMVRLIFKPAESRGGVAWQEVKDALGL